MRGSAAAAGEPSSQAWGASAAMLLHLAAHTLCLQSSRCTCAKVCVWCASAAAQVPKVCVEGTIRVFALSNACSRVKCMHEMM